MLLKIRKLGNLIKYLFFRVRELVILYNIYRIIYNLRAYNKPRILRVLIREFNSSLIS